ncbi:hypothetical protein EVAR_37768_1 [Eumeta japonica]|uniref:Uncharacterized protein n=1 Tax=Eumeta variegata TaxID=151549 RepID=A0A4C1WNE3_EUMVA|nr:hypothetical protein EVAR_37768_1 [Eumeta japonica]
MRYTRGHAKREGGNIGHLEYVSKSTYDSESAQFLMERSRLGHVALRARTQTVVRSERDYTSREAVNVK